MLPSERRPNDLALVSSVSFVLIRRRDTESETATVACALVMSLARFAESSRVDIELERRIRTR